MGCEEGEGKMSVRAIVIDEKRDEVFRRFVLAKGEEMKSRRWKPKKKTKTSRRTAKQAVKAERDKQ